MWFNRVGIRFLITAFAALTFAPGGARAGEASKSCDEQPVLSIGAGNLDIAAKTITVKAYGMAPTMGWTSPMLKRMPSGEKATIVFEFVGCRPAFGAEVITPISAAATIPAQPGTVKRIVIRASMNSQTLNISEFQNTYHANGHN